MWERKGERETALSDERTKATTCGHRNTETPNFSAARIFARHTDTARHRNSNPQPPTSNAFAARLCRYFGSPASMAFVIDGRLQAAMEGDSAVEKLKRLVVEEGVSLTAVNNLRQAYQPMHLAVRTLACWLGLLAWLYSPTFRRVSRCRRHAIGICKSSSSRAGRATPTSAAFCSTPTPIRCSKTTAVARAYTLLPDQACSTSSRLSWPAAPTSTPGRIRWTLRCCLRRGRGVTTS